MDEKYSSDDFDKIIKELEKIYAILDVQGAAIVEGQEDIKSIKESNYKILKQTNESQLIKIIEKINRNLIEEVEGFTISLFNQLRKDTENVKSEIETFVKDVTIFQDNILSRIKDDIKNNKDTFEFELTRVVMFLDKKLEEILSRLK